MKYFANLISAAIILWIVFYALTIISKDNTYTSVRKYLNQEQEIEVIADTWSTEIQDTEPPIIEILNYKNKQLITEPNINIQVKVTDNVSTSGSIIVEWDWLKDLIPWYNPIVVSATDEAGNVGATYIIIEKQ